MSESAKFWGVRGMPDRSSLRYQPLWANVKGGDHVTVWPDLAPNVDPEPDEKPVAEFTVFDAGGEKVLVPAVWTPDPDHPGEGWWR